MAYDIVTFDTQTVMHNSFNFDGALLAQLKTLRHEPVQVVVSEIVRSEILKHLTTNTKQAADNLENYLRKAREHQVSSLEMVEPVDRIKARMIAVQRFTAYLSALNAEVLQVENLTVNELMKRYFAASPPFSTGAKKDEFPDAVTLLSIDAWAKAKGFRVLAISNDKDWSDFAGTTENIDVVKDVTEALALLKEQSDEARVAAGKILDDIDNVADEGLVKQLNDRITDALSYVDVTTEATSYLQVEAERPEITLYDYSLVDVEKFQLIDAAKDLSELTVEVEALLTVDAEATIYLSVHDSIDGDYVSLGGTTAATQQQVDAKLLITFNRFDEGCEVDRVDIIKFPSSIDFGEVEPDFSDEYYDEEPPERVGEPAPQDGQLF